MSSTNGDHQDQRNQDQRNARLAELEATRRQIEAYQTLLQEVPTIFERKFRERMHPVLDRNREIAAESQLLREQLSGALPPATPAEVAQLPGNPAGTSSNQAANYAPTERTTLRYSDKPNQDADFALGGHEVAREGQPIRAPRRGARPLLWGFSGVSVIALSLILLGPMFRQIPLTQLSRLLNHAPADPNALGLEELQIISKGSWVEVEDASGNSVYAGILEGERRFPIGPGLRLNAGRPDLVRYRIGTRPAAPLGAIEDVGWRRLASPLKDPAGAPVLETNLPQH